MAANDLVITISARDEATKVLKDVRGEFDKAASAGTGQFTSGLSAIREVMDKLSGSSIPGLSGALRGLAGTMTQSVTGAATGMVSALVTYGIALNRAADEHARFQRALDSINVGTIRSELSRINDEMNRFADTGNRIGNAAGTWGGALQSVLSRFEALPRAIREVMGLVETPESQRAAAMTRLGGLLGAQEGAKQTQMLSGIAGTEQRALLFQQQRRANEENLAAFLALLPQLEAADRKERDLAMQALRQRQGFTRAEAIKEGIPLAPLEKTFQLEEQALGGELAISLQRQKIAREEQGKALAGKLIDQRFTPLAAAQEFAQEEAEQQFALAAELQRQADDKAAKEREAADARLRMAETYADFVREEAEQQAALETELSGQRTKREAVSLDVAVRLAQIAQGQFGLTASELAQAQLVTIERQRQLDLSKARNDSERELADLTARVQASSVAQRESERTDPTAGAVRGFKDVEAEMTSAGDRMRTAVVQSFHDINQGFSDIVVSGLTGEIDKIGDIGKQLGRRLLSGFIGELSGGLTARLFASLREGLGLSGGAKALTVVPALASPFIPSAGAGTGVAAAGTGGGGVGASIFGATYQPAAVTTTAGAGSVTAGAASPTGAASALSAGDALSAVGQFGRGFFGPTVSAVDLFAAYQLGGFSAVAAVQAGQAVIVSTAAGPALVSNAGDLAAALSSGVGEAAASSAGSAGLPGAATGLGASAASVAGGVLAGAALAYSAYSAYQTGDPAGGALSGAISGAALGTVISPGVGTIIGLVAGAAIGGGAGMLGKEALTGKQKKEAEIKGVQTAAGTLIGQVRATTSTEDLYALLVSWGSELSGGTLHAAGGVAVVSFVTVDGERLVVGRTGPYPIADKDAFVAGTMAGTYEASIQQGIAQHYKDDANEQIVQAVTAQVRNLVGIEQGVLFGYNEDFRTGARGAGGSATRQTVLAYSRRQEAQGQDLFVLDNTLANLTPDQAQRLLEQLVKVDRDRDLQILRVESDFGATVTVGYFPSTGVPA